MWSLGFRFSFSGEVHLGYSVDEIRFRSWYGFIHPDDSSRAVAVVKNGQFHGDGSHMD